MAKLLSDSEIMQMLLDELRYKAAPFAEKLGYSSASTIYFILSGDNKISKDMEKRILEAFPEVNLLFLSLGQLPIRLNTSEKIGQSNLLGIDERKHSFDEVPKTLNSILDVMLEIRDLLKEKLSQ